MKPKTKIKSCIIVLSLFSLFAVIPSTFAINLSADPYPIGKIYAGDYWLFRAGLNVTMKCREGMNYRLKTVSCLNDTLTHYGGYSPGTVIVNNLSPEMTGQGCSCTAPTSDPNYMTFSIVDYEIADCPLGGNGIIPVDGSTTCRCNVLIPGNPPMDVIWRYQPGEAGQPKNSTLLTIPHEDNVNERAFKCSASVVGNTYNLETVTFTMEKRVMDAYVNEVGTNVSYTGDIGTDIHFFCYTNGATEDLILSCGSTSVTRNRGPPVNGSYSNMTLTLDREMNGKTCTCKDPKTNVTSDAVLINVVYEPVIEFRNCSSNNSYIREGQNASCECVVSQQGSGSPVTVQWSGTNDTAASNDSVLISVSNNGTGIFQQHECMVTDNQTVWSHGAFRVNFAYGPNTINSSVTGGNIQNVCDSGSSNIEVKCSVDAVVPPLVTQPDLTMLSKPYPVFKPTSYTANSWTYVVNTTARGTILLQCLVPNPTFSELSLGLDTSITINAPPSEVSMTIRKEGEEVTEDMVPGVIMPVNVDTTVAVNCTTVGGHPASSNLSLVCGQHVTSDNDTAEATPVGLNLTVTSDLVNCVCTVQHEVSGCAPIVKTINFQVTPRITNITLGINNNLIGNATKYISDNGTTVNVSCKANGWTRSGLNLSCGGEQQANAEVPNTQVMLVGNMNGAKCVCRDDFAGIETFVTLEVRYKPVIVVSSDWANNTYIRIGEKVNASCVVKEQGVPPVTVWWEGDNFNSTTSTYVHVTNQGTGMSESRECMVSDGEEIWSGGFFQVNFAYGPTTSSLTVTGGNIQSLCSGPKVDIEVNCLVDVVVPPLLSDSDVDQLAQLTIVDTGTVLTPVSSRSTANSWSFVVEAQTSGDINVRCNVTNSVFSDVTSNAVGVITVYAPPSIVSMKVTKDGQMDEIAEGSILTVDENTEIEVTCETVGGYPASSSDVSLKCGQKETLETGTSLASLRFTVTNQFHLSDCVCTVRHVSRCPPIVKQASMFVNVEPSMNFRIQEQAAASESVKSVEVTEGDAVDFQCSVKANVPPIIYVPPRISLTFNASEVASGAGTETQPLVHTLRHTPTVTRTDAGIYTCSVSLNQTSTTVTLEQKIQLIVFYPPRNQADAAAVPLTNMDVDNNIFTVAVPFRSLPPPTNVQIFRYRNPRNPTNTRVRRNTEASKYLLDSGFYTWKLQQGASGEEDMEVLISMMNLDSSMMKDYDAVIGNGIGENTFPFTINVAQLLETSSNNPGSITRQTYSSNRDLIVIGVGAVVALATLGLLIYAVFACIQHCTAQSRKKKQRSSSSSQPRTRVVMADTPFRGHSLYWQPASVPVHVQQSRLSSRAQPHSNRDIR